MTKFTEILMNEKWTGKMVEDFNGSNQDLKDLKIEELKMAKENILNIVASLDDLKRSINEEIKEREKDKDREVIEDYLNSFADSRENKIEPNIYKYNVSAKDNGLTLEEIKKEVPKRTFEKKEEPKKEEPKIEVPKMIKKAIEIANKYNVGESFIRNGEIARMVERGQISAEEAIVPVMNFFVYLAETRTVSKEDMKDVLDTITKELDIENMLKSFFANALISKLV